MMINVDDFFPPKNSPSPLIFKAPIAGMSFTPEGQIVLFTDWDIGPFCLKIGDAYAVFNKPKDLVTPLTDAGCLDIKNLYMFISCSSESQAAHPILHPEGALTLQKAASLSPQKSGTSELLKCLVTILVGQESRIELHRRELQEHLHQQREALRG